MKNITKKQKIIMISIISLLMIGGLLSVSFGWFNYTKTGASNTITTKDFTFSFTDSSDLLINNDYPTSVSNIGTRYDSTFTITSNNDLSNGIGYKVYAIVGDEVSGRTRMLDDVVKVEFTPAEDGDGFTTVQNRYRSPKSLEFKDGKADISTGFIQNTNGEVTKTYKVSMWIDDSSIFVSSTTKREAIPEGYPSKAVSTEGNVEATRYMKNDNTDPSTVTLYPAREEAQGKIIYTTYEFSHSYYSIKIVVEAQDGPYDVVLSGSEKVLKALDEHATGTCQNIKYVEDGITYFSGTNDCINFNYVWYSGKLWRITAIYDDGTMKLITENNITSIAFNEDASSDATKVNFYNSASDTSYMYQWLNEDFYDTLYQPEKFIDTTKRWNATNSNASSISAISTPLPKTTMVTANVGLLNSYEYYNSYRCIGSTACTGSTYGTGYLNIGYYWRLLNPYSASNVWYVNFSGSGRNDSPTYTHGGRPSIYLKSGLEFTGSGTKVSPYKIMGDKDTGSANDLINTRLSGEYVKLVNNDSNQMFRIIGVEDNKTKIIAMDYADNKGTRKFATSTGTGTLWGSGTTLDTDTWYEYLNRVDNSDISNTGYYDKLVKTYGELFTSGTYYLGTSGKNYKLSVCANTTSGNTKVCTKTSQTGTFNIGLPRYGEMFATQQAGGNSNSIDMWLMNRNSTSYVWNVYSNGYGNNYRAPTNSYGGRPTLHLKSTVKILSGAGTESDPYIVGL